MATQTAAATPLEAASPYEMRVHLGEDVPDVSKMTGGQAGQSEQILH